MFSSSRQRYTFLGTAVWGARGVLWKALRVVGTPLPAPLGDTWREKYSANNDVLHDVKAIRSATMGSVTNDEVLLETICGRSCDHLQLVRKKFAALSMRILGLCWRKQDTVAPQHGQTFYVQGRE
jgi:hypothetical protein